MEEIGGLRGSADAEGSASLGGFAKLSGLTDGMSGSRITGWVAALGIGIGAGRCGSDCDRALITNTSAIAKSRPSASAISASGSTRLFAECAGAAAANESGPEFDGEAELGRKEPWLAGCSGGLLGNGGGFVGCDAYGVLGAGGPVG